MPRSCHFVFYILLLLSNHIALALPADTFIINQLLTHSKELQRSNEDSSYFLAQKALGLSKNINYQKGIATALMRIGSVLSTKDKNDSALTCIQKAYEIRKSLGDFKGASGACVVLSYIYQSLGMRDSAFSKLYESLRINERVKDSINIVQTYISLGKLKADDTDYKSSFEYYHTALKIAETMKYDAGIMFAKSGIGQDYLRKSENEKALEYFIDIDSLSLLTDDVISNAQNLTNIGLCYLNLNKPTLAQKYFHRALTIYQDFNMSYEISNCYYNLGLLFKQSEQIDSAIVFFQKAVKEATKASDIYMRKICDRELSEVYAKKGDYDKAYQYHVEYSALSDLIMNKEKVKTIAEIQTKYETEKKEQKIGLLKSQKSLQFKYFLIGSILLLILGMIILTGLIRTRKAKQKSDELLLNILPAEVAEELKHTGKAVAKQYNHVSVMFTDFVNFTGISENLSPTELVEEVNRHFTAFDAITEKYGLEKIKTIGDAYLAVCGLPIENEDHAIKTIRAALEIQQYIRTSKGKFAIRIGIHSGAVVAGIVGVKKFAYDIWGDTVNTASRMESSSEGGKINISEATYTLVKGRFHCTYRGKIDAKHKGLIDMYFVKDPNA